MLLQWSPYAAAARAFMMKLIPAHRTKQSVTKWVSRDVHAQWCKWSQLLHNPAKSLSTEHGVRELDWRLLDHIPTMCQLEMVKGIHFLTSHCPENPIPFCLWPQVSVETIFVMVINGLHVFRSNGSSQFLSSQTLHSDSPNWLLHPWPYSASVTFFQSSSSSSFFFPLPEPLPPILLNSKCQHCLGIIFSWFFYTLFQLTP